MKYFMTWFAKITGFIPYWLLFRPKVMYKNRKKQGMRIKGSAILISNHTSVYDFPLMLMIFPFRLLRYLMGEMLFNRSKMLSWFLRAMGGIEVNRANFDMSFLTESLKVLDKGGVIGTFPEARINENGGELRPFTASTALLAVKSGAPVIPVYFTARKKKFQRAHVMVGEPVYLKDYCIEADPSPEKLTQLAEILRQHVITLKIELERRSDKKIEEQQVSAVSEQHTS